MSKETKKHIIIRKPYTYECGDHCCFDMGHDWYVDGISVHSSSCEHNALLAILKHFGIDAQIDFCGEDDPLDDPQFTLY